MDRVIIYPSALPMTEDLLTVQRSVMSGLGYLIQATLGTGVAADGLACGPVSPPSLTLEVGPGSLTSFGVVDANPFSTLAASANPLVRMGIASSYTPLNFVAPAGAGTTVDYLIQAAMEEVDAIPLVLDYYNAANPAQPYAGPGGAGGAQATVRQQAVALQVKAGAPAVSGSQVAPGSDAGWVPLYVVSVPAGTTGLTAANIAVAPGAPFIGLKIPGLDAAVAALQGAVGAASTGLAAEVARAQAAEAGLNQGIGNETVRAEGVEANLNTAIGNEASRAEAAEANLANALNTDVANLSAALNTDVANLNTAIGNEATSRNNADAAEATARNNADQAEAQARAAGDAAVSQSIPPTIVAAFQQSLVGNGWCRLPSGLIIQWGVSSTQGEIAVALPTTFPNVCFGALATESAAGGWLLNNQLVPTFHGTVGVSQGSITILSLKMNPDGIATAPGSTFFFIAAGC